MLTRYSLKLVSLSPLGRDYIANCPDKPTVTSTLWPCTSNGHSRLKILPTPWTALLHQPQGSLSPWLDHYASEHRYRVGAFKLPFRPFYLLSHHHKTHHRVLIRLERSHQGTIRLPCASTHPRLSLSNITSITPIHGVWCGE